MLASSSPLLQVKKCCTVGGRNSGKTTWSEIMKGIIPSEYIATESREGTFGLSTLTPDTQICIWDEWKTTSMSTDMIKAVLGGKKFSHWKL